LRRFSCRLFFALIFWAPLSAVAAPDPLCALKGSSQWVSVRYVNDGDTFSLDNGQRVRIIGINTPELSRDGRPNQPLAVQAQAQLQRYLQSGIALIVYGGDSQDHYGRLLAHVFDQNHNNLTAQLLYEGLGFAISIPPNLEYRLCYKNAEQVARKAARGVWANPYFAPVAAENLRASGFKQVRGCIQRIRKYRNNEYFYLSERFRLSLPQDHRHYFSATPGVFEQGRCLIAAGWVSHRSAYRTMKLLHPDALQLLQ